MISMSRGEYSIHYKHVKDGITIMWGLAQNIDNHLILT
jgi:hypothetical protein